MIARIRSWGRRLFSDAWEEELRAETRVARQRAERSRRRRKIVEARLRGSGAPPADMVRGSWPRPPRRGERR